MSEIVAVSSDWLALREPEDARARSRELALEAAAMVPAGPIRIHDLGSGTGSMMRWLAPLLPGPQTWMLHDWNTELIDRALDGRAPLDRDGNPVTAHAQPGGLGDLVANDLAGASLVTASALLDVLTSREVHAIVNACVSAQVPALFSLSVTGEVRLSPRDDFDSTIERAFNAHQLRQSEGRRQLGPYGARVARGLFRHAGWRVRPAASDWTLDAQQPRLLREWLDGWIDAAVEQEPSLRAEGERYRRRRLAQVDTGDLTAYIRHLELLAWPR
jgi:hypothetical protein